MYCVVYKVGTPFSCLFKSNIRFEFCIARFSHNYRAERLYPPLHSP
jgi:hypothetical protein